ncbi:MAG: glycosyltransferase [Patulibacter sp.]
MAAFLAREWPVTVMTTEAHRAALEQVPPVEGVIFDPEQVEMLYVAEPSEREIDGHYGYMHTWSARVCQALKERFSDDPPALIEFQDYLGEAAVVLQARRAGHPTFKNTRIVVRLDTTAEMCAVLNGALRYDFDTDVVHGLERLCLREADALLYGGGDIYGTYQRFYGAKALAPGILLRQPISTATEPAPAPSVGDALRLLYTGRLERRKGVEALVEGMSLVGRDDVQLTLVGGDTDTAPLGQSMLELLRLASDGDERIAFMPNVPRTTLARVVAQHDLCVFPSRWECWPAVVLEAFARNRPILTTPVGGMLEMSSDSTAAWRIAEPDSPHAIADAIEQLATSRDEIVQRIEEQAPRRRFNELTRQDDVRAWYAGFAEAAPRATRRRRAAEGRPMVSVVVPYFGMSAYIEDAIASLAAQTYRPLEVIVVVDGSFSYDDRVVQSLANRFPIKVASQPNGGLGAARNYGVSVSCGKYVGFLDADNEFCSEFVERAVDCLEADLEVAYFTSWTRYINEAGVPLEADAGYRPLGNNTALLDRGNVAGDAAALVRRSVFDRGFHYSTGLSSFEDWDFYRQLRDAQLYGVVYPEALVRYRVRSDSMLRTVGEAHLARFDAELAARRCEGAMSWVP